MSGIAGLLHLDGTPVATEQLARMTDALAHRGLDGRGLWVDGAVGFGHRLLHTTPESLHETQPFRSDDGNLVIVCDGRIDNRQELKAIFGLALRTDTDVALIARAYEEWGLDCPARLIGDFAFAIWDRRAHRLLCARDPLGVSPFYYFQDERRFIFASALKAILAVPGVPRRPDEAMIADYLLGVEFRDPEATSFQAIRQLPPAHSLCLELPNPHVRRRRYWEPNPAATASSLDETEARRYFRDLFQEAVGCRLRSPGPVGVMLSGGIDSTLVVAMAETLRRQQPQLPSLTALTVLDPDVLTEEWEAIQELRRRFGTSVHILRSETAEGPLPPFELYVSRTETPFYYGFLVHPLVFTAANAHGCRVLLTGHGADELVGISEQGLLHDLLKSGRLWRLAQEIRQTARAMGGSSRAVTYQLLREALPARFRGLVKTLSGRPAPRWLKSELVQRVTLNGSTPPAISTSKRIPSMCQAFSIWALSRPTMAMMLNHISESAAAFGIECRHPFLDRRLIEGFLAVPQAVKLGAGKRKLFAQDALRDLMPLRPRRGTTLLRTPAHAVQSGRDWEAAALEAALGSSDRPVFRYLESRQVSSLLGTLRQGDLGARTPLWKAVSLARWCESWDGEQGGMA